MSLCIRLNEWDLECINWAIQLTSQSFWLHIPPFLKLSIDFLGIALVVKNTIIHTCHWFRVVFGILWLLLLLCVLLFLEKRLIFLHQDVLGITVTNLTKKKGFNNVLYSARSHFRVYWTLFGVCSTISWELFNVFSWNFVHIFFITFWWSLWKKNIWELCHL